MSELLTLLKCLPAILGLIKAIEKGIYAANTEATVKDHIATVTAAFEAKDASKLDALFNSPTDPT